MKKLIVLTLAFILLVCMTVSCDSENETNETNASGTTVGDGETPEKCSQHTSGEWIVEKEANCKEEGTKRKECSVCGEILETEVIPVNANVHNYVNYECSLCGYKYESQGLEFESNGDGTCSVKGIGTCQDTVLIIPSKSPDGDTVISVARSAFANCINITRVVIPDGVTFIGSSAFLGCKELEEISIPDGVTKMEGNIFRGCSSLKSIVIPDSVTFLGGSQFIGCLALNDVTIPFIGQEKDGTEKYYYLAYVFVGVSGSNPNNMERSIDSIVITGGTRIEKLAFFNCKTIKKLTLPKTLSVICDFTNIDLVVENLYYDGTVAEWNKITKPHLGMTVHCKDGDVES